MLHGESAEIGSQGKPRAAPGRRAGSSGYLRWILWAALILPPLALLIATGLAGIDFGYHWDELNMYVKPVVQSIETETLLPYHYYYPSLNFWLALAVLSPDMVSPPPLDLSQHPDGGAGVAAFKLRVLQAARSVEYHLRLRGTFLVLSALTLVWVFALVVQWRGSPLEAFVAASLVALSWEVGYHVRWLATDGLMMQFAALIAWLTFAAVDRVSDRLLLFAAVAAGLATGTKYTGGALLLPVLLAVWLSHRGAAGRHRRRRLWSRQLALFAATYLVTTPGMLFQPFIFREDLYMVTHQYLSGHGGYTLNGLGDYLTSMAEYLGLVLFSDNAVVAAAAAGLAVAGAAILVRQERRTAVLLLSFPVFYLLYFATVPVMIVRNLLMLVPFLAVLAARGWGEIWQRASPVAGGWRGAAAVATRVALAAAVVALWAINAPRLIDAAESIRQRGSEHYVEQAADFVLAARPGSLYLTPAVRQALTATGRLPAGAGCFAANPEAADLVVFWLQRDGFTDWRRWPENRRHLLVRQFGPWEVNLDYYMSWVGDDRIVVAEREKARNWGLLEVLDEARRSPPEPPARGQPGNAATAAITRS